jgi:dTMP kinase
MALVAPVIRSPLPWLTPMRRGVTTTGRTTYEVLQAERGQVMFVVIEGIDGAGGGTQRQALEKQFSQSGDFKSILTFKFPYYENPIGKLIKNFLYSDQKLRPEHQFLLFAGQMALDSPRIEKVRENGLVIADRWVTSTMVYQGLQGMPTPDMLEAVRIFKLATPDLIIFLDVPPPAALERDQKGKEGKEGRFEKSQKFLDKCYREYQKLMKKQVIAPWSEVDGTKSISEVTQNLVSAILARRDG